MSNEQRSLRLFSLGATVDGEPKLIAPASFKSLGAAELKDIERWIKREPGLLGEEIEIVASQFSRWDKTADRPDLLGIDREGKLVVIEIKRDGSGRDQDLQVVRYASYASTLSSAEIIELYRAHRFEEHGESLSADEASERLDEFVAGEIRPLLDDDDRPRMVLVAAAFQPGVTSTVLWLRGFDLDVTCVQIQPYELQGEIVLTSTTLIPLPQAADYEVKMRSKRRRSASKEIDKDSAMAFIASVPAGRWTSYGDVAAAGGNPKAAQGVGTWLRTTRDDIPLVYRVLNKPGDVNEGWSTTDPALPSTVEEVEAKLVAEGVRFDAGKASAELRWTVEHWHTELRRAHEA
jgi:alkylated DNA nucleotide flippase Atl1